MAGPRVRWAALVWMLAALAAPALGEIPISVAVFDEGGQPVSGGLVYCDRRQVGEAVQGGWAHDPQGRTPGFGLAVVAYAADGILAARLLRVPERPDFIAATIRLGEEPLARGRVVDSAGEGIPYARVETPCRALLHRTPYGFRTDAAGRFRLDGFCLDRTLLRVKVPGFVLERVEVSGPFPASMQIPLTREARIGLTVTDAEGNPISSPLIAAWTLTEPDARRATLQGITRRPGPGRVRILSVCPGRVRVGAYAAGYLPAVEEIVLGEGEEVSDLRLRLRRSRTVTVQGVVVGPDGEPPPAPWSSVCLNTDVGARVILGLEPDPRAGADHAWPSVAYVSALSDSEGHFELEAPPGTYRRLDVICKGYAEYMAGPIEVKPGMAPLRLEVSRGARVQGAVRMPDGSLPAEGTTVALAVRVGERTWGRREALNTETGEFLFERVPPGSARLTIEFRDCSSARAEFTVEEGAVVRPQLRFLPPAQITGRVVARDDGRPMPMVMVEGHTNRSNEYRRVLTEEDGYFELPLLTAGEISVLAWLPGYSCSSEKVDASEGGLYEVTLEAWPRYSAAP